MADHSDKREYKVKLDNTGNSKADIRGMNIDPGKEITTNKSAGRARQDIEFGEAMEADMNRYRRSMEGGQSVDEDWKDRARFDGNRNLEAGQDLSFTDKMYSPVVKAPESSKRSKGINKDNRDIEFGDDNMYFWNSNDDPRNIDQNRQGSNWENNKHK